MSDKRTDASSASLYSSSASLYSSSASLYSSSASPYSSSASLYSTSASPYSSSTSPYSSSTSPYSSPTSPYSSSTSPYSSFVFPYSSSGSLYSSSGSLYSSSISPYSSPVSQFPLLTSTHQQTFQNTTEGFVQEHSKSVSVIYIESTEEQTTSSPIEVKTEETETTTETKWIFTTRDVTFASSPPFDLTEQVPATTPKVDFTEETYFPETTTTTSPPTSIYKDIKREMWIASVEDLALYLDGVMVSTHEFQPPSSPYHVTIPRGTSLLAVHAVNIDSHTIGIISTSVNQNYVTDKRWKCTRVNPGPNWEEPGFDDSDWPIADMIIKNANCSIKSISFTQQPDSKTQSSNQESETEFRPDDEDNSVVSRASFPCIPSISREAWWISCANFHCKSVCEMFCRVRFNSIDVGKTESSVKTCDC